MIKQTTDVIKGTIIGIRSLNKLKTGESSKYATLTMKATILDKGDITLPRWIDM
jgi:hypothetical protein